MRSGKKAKKKGRLELKWMLESNVSVKKVYHVLSVTNDSPEFNFFYEGKKPSHSLPICWTR